MSYDQNHTQVCHTPRILRLYIFKDQLQLRGRIYHPNTLSELLLASKSTKSKTISDCHTGWKTCQPVGFGH